MLFWCLWIFFSKLTFSKKKSYKNTIRVSKCWLQIRPHVLLGLIWVQTLCKCYQQTTKSPQAGKEVRTMNKLFINIFYHFWQGIQLLLLPVCFPVHYFSLGANLILLQETPFQKGAKIILPDLSPLKVYQLPIKLLFLISWVKYTCCL